MSVRMQEDVDFIWHPRRRDVDEPESDAVSLQINHQRPIKIRVAVAAHERERQPDIFQLKNQARRTNIAQMPDLVRARNQRLQILGKMIMSVGEDKNSQASGCHWLVTRRYALTKLMETAIDARRSVRRPEI